MNTLTLAATGDCFITQPVPRHGAFERMSAFLRTADVRFTNLETVVRQDEGFPSAQSGGTWATSDPAVLEDIRDYGFNLVAWANNHTLDYSYGGLQATARSLDAHGFTHAGAGQDLETAGAVKYLETAQGKVALIAATSSFHESWRAGAQRPGAKGRPGVNPLRFQTVYKVAPPTLESLRAATSCGINAWHDLMVKEGFFPPPPQGTFTLGNHLFAAAEDGREREETSPHPGDLKRILTKIREAVQHSGCVVVSIHSHESGDGRKDQPADFLVTFARACIDAGAHAIVGHGPHILRGVEIYRDRPIFYSLGNFIFQNELVRSLPADFYEQYQLEPALSVQQALDRRSDGGKRGLAVNAKVWHSVVARWQMTGGRLTELTLHPVTLGFGQHRTVRGIPHLTEDNAPLDEIRRLSLPFRTEFRLRGPALVWP